MSKNAFISAYSLSCALGKTQAQITKNIRNFDNFSSYDNSHEIYAIKGFSSAEEKFYSSLSFVINDAIKKAKLSKKDRENLHVFLGSTSYKISLDEKKLTHLGYELIGDFVLKVSQSKQDYTLFSTACTSSINALSYASRLIKAGKIQKALVVGFEFLNFTTQDGFKSFMLLSKDKIYRPFGLKQNGIILAEALSAVIVENTRKSDKDFAILSSCNLSDTFSETSAKENGKSIFSSLKKTLELSSMSLKDVDFIKLHGTGTLNNTKAELNAIRKLYNFYQHKAPLNALKPYIGHTLGACGSNELVLVLMCINEGFIPKTLNIKALKGYNFILNNTEVKNKITCLLNYIGFSGNTSSMLISQK